MRVSGLLLSALVALGAVAVAPQLGAVVSASSSPAQTKLDSLKSLIESSAGANPPAVCSGAPNSVPSAPGPSRGPPPATVGDYCAACKALLDFPSTARLPAACDSLPDGKTKDACTKVVQPYLTECGNAAILSEVDKVKVAKNGALTPADAQMFCNRMKNGAPATLMVAANNMNNWPAGNGDAFCSSSSLMEVATSITTETEVSAGTPCDMCQAYVKASRASRDAECVKKHGMDKCLELKKSLELVDLYEEGTNSCQGPKQLHTPCKESILCGLVPLKPSPAHKGQSHYCTPFPGFRKGPKHPKRVLSKAPPSPVAPSAAPPSPKKKSFLEAGAAASLTPAEKCQFCQAYFAPAKEYRSADCLKAAGSDVHKKGLCAYYEHEVKTPFGFEHFEKNGCFLTNGTPAKPCPPEAMCTFVKDGHCQDKTHISALGASSAASPTVKRKKF